MILESIVNESFKNSDLISIHLVKCLESIWVNLEQPE